MLFNYFSILCLKLAHFKVKYCFLANKGFSSSVLLYKILWKSCGLWSIFFYLESPSHTLTSQLRQVLTRTRTTATNWLSAFIGFVQSLLLFTPAVRERAILMHLLSSLWTAGDSTFHPEALQKGCRKTTAQKVWTHLEMPPFSETEEPLWRYSYSTMVRCLHCRWFLCRLGFKVKLLSACK